MASVPIKAEYGPTLGQVLAPRWRAATPAARIAVRALALLFLALAVAVVLTLLDASYSHGGRVPFSFRYKGLHRVAPDPGGYVKVIQRSGSGRLLYSFAVAPLTLPRYGGELSGELPLYASGYIRSLRSRDPSFVLVGEGKTKVNTVPAYAVLYLTRVNGRALYGRNVLLLGERAGAREGVEISMLTAAGASKHVDGPIEVGTTGVLQRPLRSFTLG
ncbi:MAG TPA: hypothetical protein VFW29_08220 [Solirubrobacteraceae bacterium]|nr:hypothetical protein [Solirubrobacteraceae bacterium]